MTFRDKVTDGVCYQKRLRDSYLDEPAPVKNPDLKKARVRPVDRKTAERIILKYEWLGTLGTGAHHHYGIFFGPYCAGVCSFSPQYAVAVFLKTFSLKGSELAYLSRGACVHWAPPNTNSKLISWSCRLHAQITGAKVAIAFSDTDAGEFGTVYQACGWYCLGKGSSWDQFVSPKGKIWSFNSFTQRCKTAGCSTKAMKTKLMLEGWTIQKANPKTRYVCLMDQHDERLRGKLQTMRHPYPKRDIRALEA